MTQTQNNDAEVERTMDAWVQQQKGFSLPALKKILETAIEKRKNSHSHNEFRRELDLAVLQNKLAAVERAMIAPQKPLGIVVKEYNKFNEVREGVEAINLFSYGYWNAFHYTEMLEKFLKENKIAYRLSFNTSEFY